MRLAINRLVGSKTLSAWLADIEHHQWTPLHWHDTEGLLIFPKVDADGFARVGDEEFKIESQTSVVVRPGTVHAIGMRHGNILKSLSIHPHADTVPGHCMMEKGETFEMLEVKKKQSELSAERSNEAGPSCLRSLVTGNASHDNANLRIQSRATFERDSKGPSLLGPSQHEMSLSRK